MVEELVGCRLGELDQLVDLLAVEGPQHGQDSLGDGGRGTHEPAVVDAIAARCRSARCRPAPGPSESRKASHGGRITEDIVDLGEGRLADALLEQLAVGLGPDAVVGPSMRNRDGCSPASPAVPSIVSASRNDRALLATAVDAELAIGDRQVDRCRVELGLCLVEEERGVALEGGRLAGIEQLDHARQVERLDAIEHGVDGGLGRLAAIGGEPLERDVGRRVELAPQLLGERCGRG